MYYCKKTKADGEKQTAYLISDLKLVKMSFLNLCNKNCVSPCHFHIKTPALDSYILGHV